MAKITSMKKYLLTSGILLLAGFVFAQQPKRNQKEKEKSSQSQMNKAMEDAMKDMSEEEKTEMREMMRSVMPEMTEKKSTVADYPEFTSNKQLVPKKDVGRISSIPKKEITQVDMSLYARNLYNKIMVKGDAAEIAIIKKIIAQMPKANALGSAAILCMMQGHPQAAMALSMKAVQGDPANANWQNNMASLLTQYGYPETAIPILRKLQTEFTGNSTVLNNLAYAWLGLGETDSAKVFAGYAIRANSNHPDAKLCGGLMEELNGDPIKATEKYVEAMEDAVNPFTEQMIKNNNGQEKLENLDYEKIKRSITIYEFFPKDWIKIPKLSDNVSGFETDRGIQNGFGKMIVNLQDKIDELKNASEVEFDALSDKGEDEFTKEMMKESMKGLNTMSMTAVNIMNVLQKHLVKMQAENIQKQLAFTEEIDKKRAEMTRFEKNDKCPDYDRKNNEFMAYANPLIRQFHANQIEEFRTWINAFCTWIWYIAGNPKNTVMTMCLAWAASITEFYANAVHDQETFAKSCVKSSGDGVANIATPDIPNFACPVVVSIPVGAEWRQLSKSSKNFNNNSTGIKQNANNPVPNTSIAYGIGNMIAQPGKAPFIKTANGNFSPSMINSTDDELTPLSKIPLDELSPLSKLPKDEDLNPLPKIPLDDLAPLTDLKKSKLARELLKSMMSADCNKKKTPKKPRKFIVGVGELEYETPIIEFIVGVGELEYETPIIEFIVGVGKIIIHPPTSKESGSFGETIPLKSGDLNEVFTAEDGSTFVFGVGEIKLDEPKNKSVSDVITKDKKFIELKSNIDHYNNNGLQPSISSGLQAPGTFTPNKTLFQ